MERTLDSLAKILVKFSLSLPLRITINFVHIYAHIHIVNCNNETNTTDFYIELYSSRVRFEEFVSSKDFNTDKATNFVLIFKIEFKKNTNTQHTLERG